MYPDTVLGVQILCVFSGVPLILGIVIGFWLKGRVTLLGWVGLLPLPASILRRF